MRNGPRVRIGVECARGGLKYLASLIKIFRGANKAIRMKNPCVHSTSLKRYLFLSNGQVDESERVMKRKIIQPDRLRGLSQYRTIRRRRHKSRAKHSCQHCKYRPQRHTATAIIFTKIDCYYSNLLREFLLASGNGIA